MSDPPRMREARSDASGIARDLLASATHDGPPAGARGRARQRLERALSGEGVTTHVSALSAAVAAGILSVPDLGRVHAPGDPGSPPRGLGTARPSRTFGYAAAASIAIAVLGAVGVAWVLRSTRERSTSARVVATATPPTSPATSLVGAAVAPLAAAPSPLSAPTAPAAAAPTAPAPSAGSTPLASAASAGGGPRGAHASQNRHERAAAGGAELSSVPTGGTCASRCHGDIDCLLRCSTQGPVAAGGGGSHNVASAGGGGGGSHGGDVPESPSRGDVMSAMGGVRGAVQRCGRGMTGTVGVSVTFVSSGHVTTANVAPPFAGTPAGSCIARAVRSASVPAFSRAAFTVNYPFVIR